MTNFKAAFLNFDIDRILELIKHDLNQGKPALEVLEESQDAIKAVGVKYESGDYCLSELIMSAKIFEEAMIILEPELKKSKTQSTKYIAKIILGTPKGDIHDLGKNIFGTIAKASGFEIIDIGVDVPPQKFVDFVLKEKPQIVGMSALITTVYPSAKEVVDMIKENNIRDDVKIIIGGGAVSQTAMKYIGADAYTFDAGEGVRLCKHLLINK